MKITMNELRAMNPQHVVAASDSYYAKLANMIYRRIKVVKWEEVPLTTMREIALNVVKYFEDVISGIGVWSAFRSLHNELYGKKLPFYDVDAGDYLDDEINLVDIKYLVWSTISLYDRDGLLNPTSKYIESLAQAIFEVLEDEYETAPQNTEIIDLLHDKSFYSDFIELKKLLMWLLQSCYLTGAFDVDGVMDKRLESYLRMTNGNVSMSTYAAYSYFSVAAKIGPLRLLPQQWLAAIMRYHGLPEADKVESVESLDFSGFLISDYDDTTVTFLSVDSKSYRVALDSFNLEAVDDLLLSKAAALQLAKYGDIWYLNGLSIISKEDVIYQNSLTDYQKKQQHKKIANDFYFKKADGRRLMFFDDVDKLQQWMDLPSKGSMGELADAKHLMLYFPYEDEPSVCYSYVETICSPDNPYYDEQYALENAIFIFVVGGYPYELITYLIEQGMLKDASFKSSNGQFIPLSPSQLNFLARFYTAL